MLGGTRKKVSDICRVQIAIIIFLILAAVLEGARLGYQRQKKETTEVRRCR